MYTRLTIMSLSLAILTVVGCGATGQIDAMKVASDATQISAAYFAYEQGIINTMPAGTAHDQAQAKLYSQENTAGLITAIGSIVVNNTPAPMPIVVPTTAPMVK